MCFNIGQIKIKYYNNCKYHLVLPFCNRYARYFVVAVLFVHVYNDDAIDDFQNKKVSETCLLNKSTFK